MDQTTRVESSAPTSSETSAPTSGSMKWTITGIGFGAALVIIIVYCATRPD
ncbi:MAG: hypothetical protein O3A00_01445 [Planctomycetota bacterium]|nr:hypothetical protein [Planctomycetota bacterium]